VISSGQALERFRRVVAAQGGDPRVLDDYSRLPQAQDEESVVAPEDGYIAGLEGRVMGKASMLLGAGRERSDATIDPAVGLVFEKKVGETVRTGERVCVVYANDRVRLLWVLNMIRRAIVISPDPVSPGPLVLERVASSS
jgi:thymidine phosphorylase